MKNSLFVEKYRPVNIDNYVGNESIKNTVKKYINQNDIQNLLLFNLSKTGSFIMPAFSSIIGI